MTSNRDRVTVEGHRKKGWDSTYSQNRGNKFIGGDKVE